MAMEIWYHLAGGPTDPVRLVDDLLLESDAQFPEETEIEEASDDPAPDAA